MSFNSKKIGALQPREKRFVLTLDKGLTLRVHPGGKKSFVLRICQNGKIKDVTLGHFPDLSLAQAKALAQKLQVHTDNISFLSSLSSAYTKGIVVTSAHMAKGLEFDEVIVPQADNQNYHSTIDKSMLYVATTRAMHKLTLTYSVSSPSCRFL